PSSGETREGWVKIDTIAADKSFSRVEPSLPHQYKPDRMRRINVKTRSFAPLTRRGYYGKYPLTFPFLPCPLLSRPSWSSADM
ncbi:hypothetical protein NFI96_006731, partial [Prochilodus magdalenae]